jgi:hypothetical protein
MANLFNDPGSRNKWALALAAFSQDRDLYGNLFNTQQKMDERDERKREATAKESNAKKYLMSSGMMDGKTGGVLTQDAPSIADNLFNKVDPGMNMNPQRIEGANMQQAPALSDQFFNSEIVGANAPQTDTNLFNLAKAAGPSNMLNIKMEQQLKGEEPFTLGPLERRFKNGKLVAEGITPQKAPEMPGDVQTAMWMANGDPNKARALVEQWKSKDKGEAGRWITLTPEAASKLNLPEGGTYQQNDTTGQVQVITQPKQTNPPQGYKEQMAGIETLTSTLNDFEKLIKSGRGMAYSAKAGDIDSKYAQFLFSVKQLEQTGALDKGSVEAIEGMLAKPTGYGRAIPEDYVVAQINSVRDYLSKKQSALNNSYKTGDAPSASGGMSFREGATATGPGGQKIVFKGGQWQGM